MKIIIIEDEYPAYKRLSRMVQQILINAEIHYADDLLSAAQFIDTNTYDLGFLDIELGDGSVFELLETTDINFPVIFTTAYDRFALNAFKLHTIDYLLKPIIKVDLDRAIKKWQTVYYKPKSQNVQEQERYVIKVGNHQKIISVADISYYFIHDGIVYLMTFNGMKYPLDLSLEQIEESMDHDLFFRVNRQYIVHIKSIKDMKQESKGRLRLTLDPASEDIVISSTERSPSFKNWLKGNA